MIKAKFDKVGSQVLHVCKMRFLKRQALGIWNNPEKSEGRLHSNHFASGYNHTTYRFPLGWALSTDLITLMSLLEKSTPIS